MHRCLRFSSKLTYKLISQEITLSCLIIYEYLWLVVLELWNKSSTLQEVIKDVSQENDNISNYTISIYIIQCDIM